ncbi:MAG: hypothetical protein IT531_07215 [Burkholderiales bacterium]|nr:hypothetical protein [Burkholderiales bacterium]
MTIELLDPVGTVEVAHAEKERALKSLVGARLGCIFNQHVSALSFWKAMEAEVEARFKPASIHRVYKANTWAPAAAGEVERLVRQTDYALVGVGA